MAFLDKLNNFASAASEKASGAIEIGKLNLKLNAEEKKMEEATLNIGNRLLLTMDEGQTYDEAIMALYAEVQASRAAVASIRSEIATLSGVVLCSSCDAKNPPDSKFCRECGSKLEAEPTTDAPVEIVETLCPNCGVAVDPNESFCTQCGTKLD